MVMGINFGPDSPQVTLYVNASTCTEQYNPTHKPIVFDLPPAHELREATKKAALERKKGKLQLWVWPTTWIWEHFGTFQGWCTVQPFWTRLWLACCKLVQVELGELQCWKKCLPYCQVVCKLPPKVPLSRIVTHTQCMQFLPSARACPSTSWVRSISWFEQTWRFAKRHLKCRSLWWHGQKDDLSDQTAPGWKRCRALWQRTICSDCCRSLLDQFIGWL